MKILIGLSLFLFVACTRNNPPSHSLQEPAVESNQAPYLAPPQVVATAEDMVCKKDSDCAMAPVTCSCSCGQAVNKKYVKKYTKLVDEACKQSPPNEVCKVICDGKTKCVDRRCSYL